jgi:uncharacterized protein YjdB
LAAVLLPACDAATLEPLVETEAPREILLSASALDMMDGDTLRLRATLIGMSGQPIASPSAGQVRGGTRIVWSSSNPEIAAIDAAGLVRARTSGTAVLTATAGQLSSRANARVGGPKRQSASKVIVSPEEETITSLGSSVQLTAIVLDDQDNPIADPSLTWSTQNPEIAAVDGSGKVTSRALGTALIVAVSGNAADTSTVRVRQEVAAVSVDPTTSSIAVGDSVHLTATALDASGSKVEGVSFAWSSSDPQVATVGTGGVVKGVVGGSVMVTAIAGGESGSATVRVTGTGPPPSGDEVVVSGFTIQALQQALTQIEALGGGVLRFPAGTYDLRDWPTDGVRVRVPVTMIAEGNAVLQGSGGANLFDFSKQVHIQNLEFRNWQRPIQFWRVGGWENFDNATYVRVERSRFYDVAIAVDGRRESGTPPEGNVHKIALVSVSDSYFERARRVVDFRRIYIDRFEFLRNQVLEVVHRHPEPDVPGTIVSALYVGADLEDRSQRSTEVVIAHNDIRRVRNEDQENGRAYVILAHRGPTIVEHNHIEDVAASEGSDDGAAAIYQRSRTHARFAHNRVVNGTNTPNVGAIMHKQGGAGFEVLNNEIVFTDAFKDLHNSVDYTAFEGTLADLRFEGNVVRGATRQFVTRMDTNNYGRAKTQQIVRNNTFEDCDRRPDTSGQRTFVLGYRRSLVEVSGNRFINCTVRGNEFIFVSAGDKFEETDELRITNNEWIHTVAGARVPSQVIRFNAYARRSLIAHNRYEYLPTNPAESPTPITLVMLPSLESEVGARVTVADNRMQGLREGTAGSVSILDSRAELAELVVERNRAFSGGNFVRLSVSAPLRTVVRDNDVTGITGELVKREVQGGELIVSGNRQ